MSDELNLEKFNPTKNELLALADEARKLTINGIDDKEGYLAVHQQRMKLQKARTQITKTGKEVREEALAFQRKVIAYEKDLIEIIEPIEKELKAKQDAIDEEKEKVKRVALLPERQAKLKEIEATETDEILLAMDDMAFHHYFNLKNSEFLAMREAKIKADQEKIEAEKLAIEQAKQLEEAKKHAEKEAHEKALRDAELAKIRAEQEKDAAVKAEREKAEAEKHRMIEEQERKEREAKEAEERRAAQEKAEKEALEKKKKYQNFLEKHEYKDDGNFKIEKVGDKVILYKKLGELKV